MFETESKAFAAEVADFLTLVGGYRGLGRKAAFRCVRCGTKEWLAPHRVRRDIADGREPCPTCRRRAETEAYRQAVITAVEAFGGEIVGNLPTTKGRLVFLRCGQGHLFALTGKRLLQGDGCPECAFRRVRKRPPNVDVGTRSQHKATPAYGQEGKGEKR